MKSVDSKNKKRILLIGPVPPPFHGASYATDLLLHSSLREHYTIHHINTVFVKEIGELQAFAFSKIFLFFKYLILIKWKLLFCHIDYVIISPGLNPGALVKDGIYTFIASRLFRKKVIWWAHGSGMNSLENSSDALKNMFHYIFSLPNKIVTVGLRVQQPFVHWAKPDLLIHNHYGIPCPEFETVKTRKESGTRIIYLSNMIDSKGWKLLFDAANDICEEKEDVYFDFYGRAEDESREKSIHDLFSSSSFEARIKYHGPVYGENKHKAFQTADIFCFPTYYPVEAFPIAILEAMQYGLPVITTDHASIPEAIIDGLGGFTIPIKNKEVLKEKLIDLIENPEKRDKMGSYNRQYYLNNFTLEKHVNRWCNILNSL